MKRFGILCTTILVGMLVTGSAPAAPKCDQRASILDLLSSTYKETLVAFGASNSGSLIEVFSSGKGDTWSIIVTIPEEGMSCLIAAGENWRTKEQLPPAPET